MNRYRVGWLALGAWWIAAAGLGGSPAWAAIMTERYELQARIAVQNTFHHDGVDKIDWVQERNELRFDLRYDFLPTGHGGWGVFERLRGNILYRARYDAIFDIRDVYGRRGFRRDDFRFPEGKLPRELFLDADFYGPLSVRLGKQQVVWGEADLFRSLDVVNPLRLDQQGLIGDDFSDYREPLWIAKALWDLGDIPYFSSSNVVELFYSPNSRPLTDRIVVSEGFRLGMDENICTDGSPFPCKRPQALPLRRTRHPWEVSRVGPYRTDAANQADLSTGDGPCDTSNPNPLQQGCGDFMYIIQNGWPTSTVDVEASMAGFRLLGKTFGGIDFSLNYLFKRTEVPGTALRVDDLFDPAIATDGSPNTRNELLVQAATTPTEELIRRCVGGEPLVILDNLHGPTPYDTDPGGPGENAFTGCELVGFWYPWTHIVGATATYNDYDYTGFIFRTEQSFSTKEPRNGKPPLAADRAGVYPTARDFDTHIKRQTQVLRSMIGFDYLTAIMNPAPKWMQQYWWSTFLKDQWFFTFQAFNEYYAHADAQIGLLDSVTDRMHHWNPVLTFLMTGFFHHDLLRPTIAAGYDVNDSFPVVWLQTEYRIGKLFTVRLGDIMYLGSQNAESFIFLHKYADRDNLYLRVTYWLI